MFKIKVKYLLFIIIASFMFVVSPATYNSRNVYGAQWALEATQKVIETIKAAILVIQELRYELQKIDHVKQAFETVKGDIESIFDKVDKLYELKGMEGNVDEIWNKAYELIPELPKVLEKVGIDPKSIEELKKFGRKLFKGYGEEVDKLVYNSLGLSIGNQKEWRDNAKKIKEHIANHQKTCSDGEHGTNCLLQLEAYISEKGVESLNNLGAGISAVAELWSQKERLAVANTAIAEEILHQTDDGQILFDEAEKAKQRQIPTHWRD